MATATLSPSKSPALAPSVELVRAPLAALTLPSSPTVDVYASTPGTDPKLLWDGHARLGETHLALIRSSGDRYTFWVARNDFQHIVDAVQSVWREVVKSHKRRPCERFALAGVVHALELQATLRLVRCTPHVNTAKRVGAEVAAILMEQPVSSRELFDAAQLSSSNPFRGHNLAGYAVQLAKLSGITDFEEIEQIAMGALVHDVGARTLPVDPAANSGRWTAEEREQVERHPQTSYELLLACGLARGQLMMAYQHHERIDGRGYPVGILGEEIHPWARMMAIVDRFDAMTTARGYRRALELPEALDYLEQEAGSGLDLEMTQCWIRSLKSN
jgi:HD-GYP domain-containing protein (c-di-GMP phosphodiesterase class II)